jgi:hypothetical protein
MTLSLQDKLHIKAKTNNFECELVELDTEISDLQSWDPDVVFVIAVSVWKAHLELLHTSGGDQIQIIYKPEKKELQFCSKGIKGKCSILHDGTIEANNQDELIQSYALKFLSKLIAAPPSDWIRIQLKHEKTMIMTYLFDDTHMPVGKKRKRVATNQEEKQIEKEAENPGEEKKEQQKMEFQCFLVPRMEDETLPDKDG